MKKIVLSLSLLGLVIFNQSCNKNESSTAKIDFTKSYEDAASALASAQKSYDEALATNDPVKIDAAKKLLKEAQAKYLSAKDTYVSEGGKVKDEYENLVNTSKESIDKTKQAATDLTKAAAETAENKATTAVTETANKINSTIEKTDAKVTEVKDKVAAEKAKVTETAKKTQEEVQKTKDNINKTKQDLKNILTQ